MNDALTLAAGVLVLVVGAEMLVRGAARLAAALGVSALVAGLTVVAFGTSSPELAVSTRAATSGSADVALGNVVGSNVFNVLFILGLSAVVMPLGVARQLVRFDVPIMIAVSLAAFGFCADGIVSRLEGCALAAGLVVYTGWLVRIARRAEPGVAVAPRAPSGARARLIDTACIAAGLGLLVLGAGWMVDASTGIARALGLSDLVIGLTIVAAGTSLPEAATSIVASVRGQRDIAVGNVVGSCTFNLLGVLGLSAAIAPGGVAVPPAALEFDLPVMLAVAVACLPVFLSGRSISRFEGGVFLAYYGVYLAFLVLAARSSPALGSLSSAMLFFVLPITALTAAVLWAREERRSREADSGPRTRRGRRV